MLCLVIRNINPQVRSIRSLTVMVIDTFRSMISVIHKEKRITTGLSTFPELSEIDPLTKNHTQHHRFFSL